MSDQNDPTEVDPKPHVATRRLRRAYDLCLAGRGHTAEVAGLIADALNHLPVVQVGRCTCPRLSTCPVHGDGGAANARMVDIDV